jgi:serine/threonine-protein kinase
MRRLIPARLLVALRVDPSASVELPGEPSAESRRRVTVAASIGSIAYAVFLIFGWTRFGESTPLERSLDLTHDLMGLWLCSSLWLVSALPRIGDRAVLAIALVVEVLIAAMISIHAPWSAYLTTGKLPGLTWVVPVIILFPLLVPTLPRTTLLVSSAAALTMPLGMALLASLGVFAARSRDYASASVTGAVAVGIAAVASRTVYTVRRRAADAIRMVGSYELLERVGQGGMGEVWKARHSFLARPAAVKLILSDTLRGPEEERRSVVERFTREAQITASLRSPHTVELFDFGVGDDGTFYYAMEFLDGMNLAHFVYQFGPIEPRRAVHWLEQACHSLGEAHARALVHRDIKPSNLFVCRYGRDCDFVKILDFGLAKPAQPSTDPSLTATGTRMGTPGYMAPEQIFGADVDPRADLYALGCVGYWLLAGAKPFESEHSGELMRLHAQEDPPPLSAKAGGAVPPRLERVIMSCLSKRPEERPASADQLSRELTESLEEECWTGSDARAWWARNLEAPRGSARSIDSLRSEARTSDATLDAS